MRNLIVLGAGRSGTSCVASLFRRVPSIYFGYEALAGTLSNARGYYEDEVVNTINNILLRQMTGTAILDVLPEFLLRRVEKRFPWTHRDTRSLWLARPTRPWRWRTGYELAHLMGRICAHQPFCLKDPRFSFTLPLWQPYLPNGTRFLAVFRDPELTVQSMMRDAKSLYDPPLALTEDWAFDHWRLAYSNIITMRKSSARADDWLFINFDDVLDGSAFPAIETFADCHVDPEAIEQDLVRFRHRESASENRTCAAVFDEMLQQAQKDLLGRQPRRQPNSRDQPNEPGQRGAAQASQHQGTRCQARAGSPTGRLLTLTDWPARRR